MSANRAARYATVILVAAIASFAFWRAASVFAFAVAERVASGQTARVRLLPYVDAPEIGARARLDILGFHLTSSPSDRASELGRLLALTPLAGGAWLDLAIARLASGAGADKAIAALAFSNLTAPNEADIMAARATFGLPLWSVLPLDLRRRLAVDLAGGWDSVDAVDRAGLTLAFSAAPEETREQIVSALSAFGAKGEKIEAALGLRAAASPPEQGSAP